MKKIIIGLLALTSVSVFAGTIVDRSNGNYLEFTKISDAEIVLTSNVRDFKEERIALDTIKVVASNLNFDWNDSIWLGAYAATRDGLGLDEIGDSDLSVILQTIVIPFYSIPTITTMAIDLAALPITAPLRLLKRAQNKRDRNVLMKASMTEKSIKVTSKRFRRIFNELVY